MVAEFMLACLGEVGLIGSSAQRVASTFCDMMTHDGLLTIISLGEAGGCNLSIYLRFTSLSLSPCSLSCPSGRR